jgi:hypothetical protein
MPFACMNTGRQKQSKRDYESLTSINKKEIV